MTFILDMASGTEYLGEELGCPTQRSAQPATDTHCEYPQLQLEMVTASTCEQRSADLSPGLDIEALIQSLDD